MIHLSNGESLSIVVPSQTFDSFASGSAPVSLGVGDSFLLTAPTATVPEPSPSNVLFAALVLLMLTQTRLHRG